MASLGDFIRGTIDQRIMANQSQNNTVVQDIVTQDAHRMGVVTEVSGVTVTVILDSNQTVIAYAGPAQARVGDRVTVSGNRVFG